MNAYLAEGQRAASALRAIEVVDTALRTVAVGRSVDG